MLFQTVMGFQSGARWVWEALYFALTLLLATLLWRNGKRGGRWCALLAPAAAFGAAACQNFLLGGALAVLAIIILARGKLSVWLKIPAGLVLTVSCLWVMLSLAVDLLGLGATKCYLVPDPAGNAQRYAQVKVVDPGAMGRIRYHAVEQRTLVDWYPLCRVSMVTGRDCAASGAGKYGFVIDAYFEE